MFRNCKDRVVVAWALLLAVWLLAPERATGWSAGGHRVVANIAYDRLKAGTRAKIVNLLRKHPDFDKRFKDLMPEEIKNGALVEQDRWIFLQASIWPDLVRLHPPYHKETWHFTNLPHFLSDIDKKALGNEIKPTSFDLPNPLTDQARDQLNCVQAFKYCIRGLTDSHSTDQEKAIFLCWVLHLGGDTHQPLHSTSLISRGRFNTSEGDRGGNGIKTKQGVNLHSFWDHLLGGDQTMNDIRGRAEDIIGTPEMKKAGEVAMKKLSVEDWVQESNLLAKEFVYDQVIKDVVTAGEGTGGQLKKVDLPLEYRQKAGQMAQRRVAEAGYRVAEILKQVTD